MTVSLLAVLSPSRSSSTHACPPSWKSAPTATTEYATLGRTMAQWRPPSVVRTTRGRPPACHIGVPSGTRSGRPNAHPTAAVIIRRPHTDACAAGVAEAEGRGLETGVEGGAGDARGRPAGTAAPVPWRSPQAGAGISDHPGGPRVTGSHRRGRPPR